MILSQHDFLQAWGWNEYFNKQWTSHLEANTGIGRVVGEEKNRWRVQLTESLCVWAELSGRFRYESQSREDIPSVGDWVLCKYTETQSAALVERVLERKSCLYRRAVGGAGEKQILASNIDWAFIVTSANADFNLGRLDKYQQLKNDKNHQRQERERFKKLQRLGKENYKMKRGGEN